MSPSPLKEQDTEIRIVIPARAAPWLFAAAAYSDCTPEQFIVRQAIAGARCIAGAASEDDYMPENSGDDLNGPKASEAHDRN